MKLQAALVISALAATLCTSAFAQTPSYGKSRAQVRAELVSAEAQGLVHTPPVDYPPSARSISRNREIFAAQHPGAADASFISSANPDRVPAGTTSAD